MLVPKKVVCVRIYGYIYCHIEVNSKKVLCVRINDYRVHKTRFVTNKINLTFLTIKQRRKCHRCHSNAANIYLSQQ